MGVRASDARSARARLTVLPDRTAPHDVEVEDSRRTLSRKWCPV